LFCGGIALAVATVGAVSAFATETTTPSSLSTKLAPSA
jgi:hypothetical protein